MTLDQLMAFTVSPDHERQEQVWEALQRSYTKEPYYIRRLLTDRAVRASDKRATRRLTQLQERLADCPRKAVAMTLKSPFGSPASIRRATKWGEQRYAEMSWAT